MPIMMDVGDGTVLFHMPPPCSNVEVATVENIDDAVNVDATPEEIVEQEEQLQHYKNIWKHRQQQRQQQTQQQQRH